MTKEQFNRFATEIARLLIRGGAVTFARDVPEEIDGSQFDEPSLGEFDETPLGEIEPR